MAGISKKVEFFCYNLLTNMKMSIKRVIVITLILNIVLSIIKLGGGFLFNSPALKGDGFNSLMDIFVSIILLITFKVRNKAADKNHPYGHEKFEGVAYLMLGNFILLTGGFIVITNILDIVKITKESIVYTPNYLSIVVAALALVIKSFLFLINYHVSKIYASPSLKADSLNHLLDILVTSVALVGIVLSRFLGYYFEYSAAIIIGIVIIVLAIKMLKEGIYYLVDTAPEETVITKIREVILGVEGVTKIDDLKVRSHMNKVYVDVEISIDEDYSFKRAHAISEAVHDAVELDGEAIHCMVHANPRKQ